MPQSLLDKYVEVTRNYRTLLLRDAAVNCDLPKHCKELENQTVIDTLINIIMFHNILGQTFRNLKK
jgi:hypothetical protein